MTGPGRPRKNLQESDVANIVFSDTLQTESSPDQSMIKKEFVPDSEFDIRKHKAERELERLHRKNNPPKVTEEWEEQRFTSNGKIKYIKRQRLENGNVHSTLARIKNPKTGQSV